MIKHLACVMDGNRRWAKKEGKLSLQGHYAGAQAVQRVAEFCIERGIPYLSLYTFSLENFRRSEEEKSYLFDILTKSVQQNINDFISRGIRLQFVGDRTLFPESVRSACESAEQQTAHLTALTVNLLFCYGAQQELVSVARALAKKVHDGSLKYDDITQEVFEDHVWTRGTPNPDVVIRTGGAVRLSNFLLYQTAYSEFYFLDTLWPDLAHADLQRVVDDFAVRKRNFGA